MITPLLIDALTVSNRRFKKPCPVLVLKMMLLDKEMTRFSQGIKNQALLLFATYRKLLLAVDMDLCDVKALKNSVKKRHWGKADKVQYKTIFAGKLRLKNVDLEELPLFFIHSIFLKSC